MQSTPNLTQTDPHADPHDHVLVARVAEEFSELAHDAIGRPSADVQTHIGADFAAGPSVLPVDTTFRAAAVNDGQIRGGRPSAGKRAFRSFIGFLLAVCIGAAAFAWQSYGDAARQTIAKWAPQLGLTSSPPLENSGLSEPTSPPAVQASAAKAAAAQTINPAQPAAGVATNTAAPPPEGAQSLAADLANAGQEIAQLKASIEQLKTSQEQMSRDIAKVSEARTSEAKASEARVSDARASEIRPAEQNLRPRVSPPPRRLAAVPARRPMPAYYPPQQAAYPPPQAAAVPPLPQAVAPPVLQQPEPPPPATAQPEAELIPRPPMPVR